MTYEGNKRVRYYKLQKLWAEYDAMKMADDESIDEFHSRLINMTNEFARLGDPFAEHTIVKKFLRALPLRFRGKATIIQEVQDLNTYSLDELVANLQKFERYHKLKKLWTEHDAMAMADDESINDFHSRLIYMTNEFARLGVPFTEDTIVKKFLRALPLSFQDKVTAIEEFRDLDTYPLNELLWNLQAYEMSIKERKLKSVASHVMRKEEKKTKDTKPRFTQKRHTKDINLGVLNVGESVI